MVKKKDQKASISIDGTDYILDELSETAKAHILHIQFVDEQLVQIKNEWAVADTARIAYTNALKNDLQKS